jgi:PKD repeat protein
VVTVDARNSNGQPLRNLSVRAEIVSGGVAADFGTLSARNVVTDANGRATVVYTAPQAPAVAVDNFTIVSIVFTPIDTDFGNSTSKAVDIRLVPPGMIVPPDGLAPKFAWSPGTATDHQSILFDGSGSTSNATNPITGWSWDFGDGETATGSTVTHAFDEPGTFIVTLTISDAFGRSASTSETITITPGGAGMTANIVVSPTPVVSGQQAFFNGSTSTPSPGHTITKFNWNFGDGTTGSGATTSHTYATAGTYTVVLTITDDAGHTMTTSLTITVTNGAPTADFTFSPTVPTAFSAVNFDGSSSAATGGRTITAYSWSFGDGGTGTGSTISHTFLGSGAFNVTLTVTDSAGATSTTTKTVSVS